MSMKLLTFFQILEIFGAYSVITLLIPHLVVGKAMSFRNRYERFLMYTLLGNFYVMNLVFLLELLHISCPATLIIFTLLPCGYIKIKLEHLPAKEIVSAWWQLLKKLTGGQVTVKALRVSGKPERERAGQNFKSRIKRVYINNFSDVLLVVILILVLFFYYGNDLLKSYGYKALDLIVHNYWVNALSENELFVAGVYPEGFHCIIYYMHAVFSIDTFVIFRILSFIQVTWIFITILAFGKLVFKSKYVSYIAPFMYVLTDIFGKSTYTRFYATLPQEYGMIFILPAAYYGIEYFREQRREIRGSSLKKPLIYLAGFAMAFAMTLEVHFYNTMIVGVFALAICLGFIPLLFRKTYFKRVLLTCFLSVFVAVLPMLIAYVTGTELEGSLKWGLGKMSFGGTESNVTEGEYIEDYETWTEDEKEDSESEEISTDNLLLYLLKGQEAFRVRVEGLVNIIANLIADNDFAYGNTKYAYAYILMLPLYFLLAVIVSLFSKDKSYSMAMVTLAAWGLFMIIMEFASRFGLPQLMGIDRANIYVAFSIPVVFAGFADLLVFYLSFMGRGRNINTMASFLAFMSVIYWMMNISGIREPYESEVMQSNGAIICLTNIIKTEKDYAWTIVSANDEHRMGEDHGYHYEAVTFLRNMEGIGNDGRIRIPTQTVYFFVEKEPLTYYTESEERTFNEEDAKEDIPLGNSLGVYQGDNRFIIMSKLYYWAEAFMKLYPNEMVVYYECEDFICYRCEQNTYRLFNFAIDYGYNTEGYHRE